MEVDYIQIRYYAYFRIRLITIKITKQIDGIGTFMNIKKYFEFSKYFFIYLFCNFDPNPITARA